MEESRLRGALIGCGYASRFQLEAWKHIPAVEIVAVASRNARKARHRADEFDIPSMYTDYVQMLDKEDLDFVDIATPPIVHLEMVKEAAQRKLHILCQKPISETLGELLQMIDICNAADVRFMVNENGRFQPWFREIKALLDSGEFGRPFHLHVSSQYRMTLPRFEAGDQETLLRDMPRLITFELGVHLLDTLRYLLGEPISLYSTMDKISSNVAGEDIASILLKLEEAQAVIEMSWASLPPRAYEKSASWSEVRIEAETGTVLLETDGTLSVVTDGGRESKSFQENGELLGYVGAQQHFSNCLLSGREFETSGKETYKTMELVFGAYFSALENKVYHIREDRGALD